MPLAAQIILALTVAAIAAALIYERATRRAAIAERAERAAARAPRVPVLVIDADGVTPGTLTSDEGGDLIELDTYRRA